jgi:eukaryotic-like serine/threonine-protein kinase
VVLKEDFPMTERDIFLAVIDLPDQAARAVYIEKACAGNAALRGRVEGLLRSHDTAGSFLGTPAAALPEPDSARTISVDPTPVPDSAHAAEGTSCSEQDDELRSFLATTTRPDSLGRIGHYEILQILGRGGFGIVFRAFDEVLHRVVAVKMMTPQMAATSPARRRFLREARTSAAVRHENVVQIHEVGEQPLPYLVMEFIPGETLQQRLDRSGPLDVPEVLRIGRQIAEGLAAAHASDLIHRDVKPGNILLEGGAQKVKITDFGLARAVDDASMTQSGTIAGTPMYMAPEQVQGHTLDQRADLFSLSSVLYQMVTGRPPFRANNTMAALKRVTEDTPRPCREIIPETPQWLCEIIAKLHAKNPDERYQSAREVADVLSDCEAQLKANSKLKDFSLIPRGKSQPSGRRKWAAAAAVVMLPVIALAVMEFAGVTHLFRGQQATADATKPESDATKPESEPTPGQAAKKEMPVPAAIQQPLQATFKNSIGMEFVIVPRGKSWLGGSKDILCDNEVEIPSDFYLSKYVVTQEEWAQVMGENPSWFSRTGGGTDAVKNIDDADLKRFPVESVSWDQCQFFVAKLNKLEREAGWVYRLPKEAEWEYACRGGPMSVRDKVDSAFDFYFAKPTNTLLPEQVNFEHGNGLKRTSKVGSYEPNILGLYDMHGNVWEWCDDTEIAPNGTSRRVHRGGCWFNDSRDCRAVSRYAHPPSVQIKGLGLRLARVPSGQAAK